MKIPRYYQNLDRYIMPNKVLVIYGPRQVGKTTLIMDYLQTTGFQYRLDSGEDILIRQVFDSQSLERLTEYAAGFDLVVIDEAQKIKNIGQGLKLLVDHIPGIKVIATGSSSFELAGQIGEPLTGRKRTLSLYPVSQLELKSLYNPFEIKNRLHDALVFGGYPEVAARQQGMEKVRLLHEIAGSYLLKDILEFDRIKNSKVLLDLLRLLAHQIGKEVSLSELGKQTGIDNKTAGRYLDILEKSFVIYCLRGFSRNLRKEIVKKNKYYFFDNGVRNALIANFNPLEMRNDAGMLWENFIFMERMKKRSYHEIYANAYFWRTWDQKEIDLIEEREGRLFGYEIKWGKKPVKPPQEWLTTYPESEFHVITPDNYLDFIT